MQQGSSPGSKRRLTAVSYTHLTQDVFLAVYAPGRRASLEASLRDQLHRKFLLAEDLSSGSLGSARGVLLAKEDLSLMPTALSCFADALQMCIRDSCWIQGKNRLFRRFFRKSMTYEKSV